MGKDRILVVDDDPDNRAMITHFLSSWGFIVDAAKNGRMALERVESDPPSLVLLDLEMPEMDGFEACERLKTNPKTEWIPVIIFTGLEKMSHRIRGFRHGADDYVLKTVEPDELRTRIQAVLKRTKKYSSLAALGAQQAAAGAAPPPVARAAAPAAPAATPAKAAAKRKPKPKAKAKSKAKSKPRTKAGTAQNAAAAPTASADSAVSISLERTPFPDAMKLVLAHGRSGVVEVQNGKHQGKVAVHEGGVIHAIHGQRVGEEAFYELALWRKGRFEFKQGAPAKKRTITTSTRRLLVEASRRLDAWNMIVSKVKNFDLLHSKMVAYVSQVDSVDEVRLGRHPPRGRVPFYTSNRRRAEDRYLRGRARRLQPHHCRRAPIGQGLRPPCAPSQVDWTRTPTPMTAPLIWSRNEGTTSSSMSPLL